MYRFHRTADMLSDVARLLNFAADELRDCARAASVADDRACAAIDQADMLQRQLDRLTGQKPDQTPAPTPGPLPMPECRDDGPTPTAAADDGAMAMGLRAPGSEVVSTWRLPVAEPDAPPPLDAPAPAPSARTRGGRRRKSEGEGQGEGQAPSPAPDAATEAEAVEQVAQVLGDAPRDVSGDLFGAAPAPADDFLPL